MSLVIDWKLDNPRVNHYLVANLRTLLVQIAVELLRLLTQNKKMLFGKLVRLVNSILGPLTNWAGYVHHPSQAYSPIPQVLDDLILEYGYYNEASLKELLGSHCHVEHDVYWGKIYRFNSQTTAAIFKILRLRASRGSLHIHALADGRWWLLVTKDETEHLCASGKSLERLFLSNKSKHNCLHESSRVLAALMTFLDLRVSEGRICQNDAL